MEKIKRKQERERWVERTLACSEPYAILVGVEETPQKRTKDGGKRQIPDSAEAYRETER